MIHFKHEQIIIKGFKNGDERCFAFIYNMYIKQMIYFANSLIENDGEKEDIVQVAFIKLWQKNQDFEALSAMRGFLYVTIRNDALNYMKHVDRRDAIHVKIQYTSDKIDEFTESKMIKADLIKYVIEEIEKLPKVCANICKMIFLHDMKVLEIAKKLNISVDTVRVQKARALATLRIRLQSLMFVNNLDTSLSK